VALGFQPVRRSPAAGLGFCDQDFYERSQELIENKGQHFCGKMQTQEVHENTGLIFVKPRGY
jgi:hypothetical protein